jgi:hypothetical protein
LKLLAASEGRRQNEDATFPDASHLLPGLYRLDGEADAHRVALRRLGMLAAVRGDEAMMFPVNRKPAVLTADELLNLYDDARRHDLNQLEGERLDAAYAVVRELRAEMLRRMNTTYYQGAMSQQAFQNQLQQNVVSSLGLGGKK